VRQNSPKIVGVPRFNPIRSETLGKGFVYLWASNSLVGRGRHCAKNQPEKPDPLTGTGLLDEAVSPHSFICTSD